MTGRSFDVGAPKTAVTLYLNCDLAGRAKELGGDLSERVERLLAREIEAESGRRSDAEIRASITSSNAFIAAHGSFADEYTTL